MSRKPTTKGGKDDKFRFMDEKDREARLEHLELAKDFLETTIKAMKKSPMLSKIYKQPDLKEFELRTEMISGNYSQIDDMSTDNGDILVTTPLGRYQLEVVPVAVLIRNGDEANLHWMFTKDEIDARKNIIVPRTIKQLEKIRTTVEKNKDLQAVGMGNDFISFRKGEYNDMARIFYMMILKHILNAKAYITLTSPSNMQRTMFLMVTSMKKQEKLPSKNRRMRTTLSSDPIDEFKKEAPSEDYLKEVQKRDSVV